MYHAIFLLAQTSGGGSKPASPGGGMEWFLPIAVILVLFWLIILRPQKKEQAQHQNALKELKKGTKVISAGGIHGTIVEANPDKPTVQLEIAKGTRITVNRSSISVINPDEKTEDKKGGEK
ncbi:preprotein translocase subunit YajC [bacterium]|nr:preprotein translocase subunit YajC [bacterium]